MTGRNPHGIEDFSSPGCSDVAYGPQRLNAIIGAYEAFLDPVCGTDDLSFRLVLEQPATETPSAHRHPPAPNWMNWERHHIEVVRAAATGNARRSHEGTAPTTETFPGPMAGKTALVTGGTGGIGRATAAGLAALGARVGITGRARQARAARLAPGRAERYRLATSWLPVAPGWLSWRALLRREYV